MVRAVQVNASNNRAAFQRVARGTVERAGVGPDRAGHPVEGSVAGDVDAAEKGGQPRRGRRFPRGDDQRRQVSLEEGRRDPVLGEKGADVGLRAAGPEAFRPLSEADIPFCEAHDGIDMRARPRVIALDRHGAVPGVTVSRHMADRFDLPQRVLDSDCPALVGCGRMVQAPDQVMRFGLRAGACVTLGTRRVVHGAGSASGGEWHLRGTRTERGGPRGRVRALVAEGRCK